MCNRLSVVLAAVGAVVLSASVSASQPGTMPRIVSMEQTIRSQVELYAAHYGDVPWSPGEVAELQWAPLVEEDYLQAPPRNPLASPDVATVILELTAPGDCGETVDPAIAGWVWNSTDHTFCAVGIDDWIRQSEQRERRRQLLVAACASVVVLAVLLYVTRAVVDALPLGSGAGTHSD